MSEPLANVDPELERALVAEAVFNHERYIAFGLASADYAMASHQVVVEAAREAWELEGTVDSETVAKTLQRAGKLERLGGQRGLAEMLTSSAVADPERLRELGRLRRVRDRALEIAKFAERGDMPSASDALGSAYANVFDTAMFGEVLTGRQLAERALEALTSEARDKPRIHPGLPKLAEALGALSPGSVLVVGGNTSVGKSSFVLEMLLRCAARDVSAGLVSVEDPDEVTGSRLLATISGVSSKRMQRGEVDDVEWQRISAACSVLERIGERLLFADCTGGTELEVAAAMTKMAMRGARIIAVDYIGEVEASKKQQDRRNETRWLMKRLKVHAKRLSVALVIVSQLSRPKDNNPGREPTKHDLKEAGDLENSAEAVIVLWRTHEHDFAPVHVKLAKSKTGNTGMRWTMQRERYASDGTLGSGRLQEVEPNEVVPWQ
jgi:replicative DNA helicase